MNLGSTASRLPRREFLRGAGVTLGLPLMESLMPRSSMAIEQASRAPRMATVAVPFGMVVDQFNPTSHGFDYELTPTLQPLARLKRDFTVFSNLDHDVRGGHAANHSLWSGLKSSERAAYPDGNITADQRAAELVGHQTRFPSLLFWDESNSFTRTGVRVPAVKRPSEAFELMFVNVTEEQRKFERDPVGAIGSILDAVLDVATDSLLRTTGVTAFSLGSATVNGTWDLPPGTLTVSNAGLLSGTGTIEGDVRVFGGIDPGPVSGNGRLTIDGNVTMENHSITFIDVAGSAPGEFDTLVVTGVFVTSGSHVRFDFGAKNSADLGRYEFLTASPTPHMFGTKDGIGYSILGGDDVQAPFDLPIAIVEPALAEGLPALRDIDGDGTPDWEYRTFRLNDSTDVLPRGFMRSAVGPPP